MSEAPTLTWAELPAAFTIHKKSSSHNTFAIRPDDGGPSLRIVTPVPGGGSGSGSEPGLSLLSTAGEVATITHNTANTEAQVKLCGLAGVPAPAEAGGETGFRMDYHLDGGDQRRGAHNFSMSLDGGPASDAPPSDFQWRSVGAAWELVELSQTSSDRPVVLARGAINAAERDEDPHFSLAKRDDDAGELWKAVAVVSWLRVWDKHHMEAAKAPSPDKSGRGCCVVM